MATVIGIGSPANEAERRTIAHLRDNLPDDYVILHNFEIDRGGQLFEIDLTVIAPHAVYVVDVKGTRGRIEVHGSKWYPQARQPFTSPLLKLRGHARSLKGLITDSQHARKELRDLYVDATVILAGPNAELKDPVGRDRPATTTLEASAEFFQDASAVPSRFAKDISEWQGIVLAALQGVAQRRSGPLRLGDWEVDEQLAGTDTYTEYRAHNVFGGRRSGPVLLRVYEADPYLPDALRTQQRLRIANAYDALSRLPAHRGIVGVRSFFATEQEDRYILVTEDTTGQALRLYLDNPGLALTLDQKLRIADELLASIGHAHAHGVVHRNLSPSSILVGPDGQPRIFDFEFARGEAERSETIALDIVDDLEPEYQAPEVLRSPEYATPASDVFGAGLLLYELLTGDRPFRTPSEMVEHQARFPTPASELRSGLPEGLDAWLQHLCAFDPADRPDAAQARTELAIVLAPPDTESDLRADEFIDRYMALYSGEFRPLISALGKEETEWLEFKAALLPPPSRPNANKADGQWAVTKAVLALANSVGGVVLLGVDDSGQPVPLAHSDPKDYLGKSGWDEFTRRVLDGGLFRESGWKTATRGTWTLDVSSFRNQVSTRRATLDGQPIVALVVRPVLKDHGLISAENTKEGEETRHFFVRRRGDVGVVDKLAELTEVQQWLESRALSSSRFQALLDAFDPSEGEPGELDLDYGDLPSGTRLTQKYLVQERLGEPGSFGVAYRVIDTLGDVARVVKLILKDRHSTIDRLKKEYRTLLRLPEHPRVVRVIDADLLPGVGHPFIVFEYAAGQDVGRMIETGLLAPDDGLELARQVTEGLVHLHRHGVYHCDIKPRNLLWTSDGVRIIDFNVSVLGSSGNGHGGGSRRYLPPDLDPTVDPQPSELADRDLFALGVTIYEVVTGRYPWNASTPPPGEAARDPRELAGLSDLTPEFVDILLRAIAPKRGARFASAGELAQALEEVGQVRRPIGSAEPGTWSVGAFGDPSSIPPNTNPFVSGLLTLYSQSAVSNVGTRGLDALGELTYVETALDRELEPAALSGKFRLVIITGNAGDGKTAFLQSLEKRAADEQAVFDPPLANGRRFVLRDRSFLTNYDGSQDEGDRTNDEVLRAFFTPFAGNDSAAWPSDEVRLIAINEGRLVDFLTQERASFPLLTDVVTQGLLDGQPKDDVAVVNLNLRSVVADPLGHGDDPRGGDDSIFARLVRRLTAEHFWEPCRACDLQDRCYAFHNAKSFQDETAGPRLIKRLKTLYALTHLRGSLHMTLRDLRSALAFTLVGTRDCNEIHDVYRGDDRHAVLQGFYFNSWMGGDAPNPDRLLSLLKGVDVGSAVDPRLDRSIDFLSPSVDQRLFSFDGRGKYDRDVLRQLFDDLPRDFSGQPSQHRAAAHRSFVAAARRRMFFERRDEDWRDMLPYHAAVRLLELVGSGGDLSTVLPNVIRAINRGEGLSDPDRLGGNLAIQVREVERGTVRSYRVFPSERFSLHPLDEAGEAPFVEHTPTGLVLAYTGAGGNRAELRITLDVFEMLERLNAGYRPSIEEEQGYYLSLAVFKNVLGSEPYQEVLLTTTGHDFYLVERHEDGRLEMNSLGLEAV